MFFLLGKKTTNQKFVPTGKQERYVVTWHCEAVKTSRKAKYLLSLAVCEYSNGVCFIAAYNPDAPMNRDALKTLIIHDVYVGEDCEDSVYCLNIDCPKNKAVIAALEDSGIKTREHLENMHSNLELIRREMNLATAERGVVVYYEKPSFFHIVRPRLHSSNKATK